MEDRVQWKKIDGYEYMVSTIGTVKRMASNKGRYKWEEHDIRAHYNNKGYAIVDLWRNNKRKQFQANISSKLRWFYCKAISVCDSSKQRNRDTK